MSLANKWMRKKIPSLCNLALVISKISKLLAFKKFSPSLEQFFLTVGLNNFGNKIPMFLSYLVHNYVPFRNERILWSYFLRWFAAGWLPSVMLIRTPAILEFQACFFYTFLTVSRSPRVYSFECSVWTKSGLGIRNQNPRSNLGIGIGAETFFCCIFSHVLPLPTPCMNIDILKLSIESNKLKL